jgi:hypothetical protein
MASKSNDNLIVKTLCIPRAIISITESQVRSIFNSLNIGNIGRIDMNKKLSEKGEQYQRIFIHFNNWYSNETAIMAKERLINGKEIKIIYDDPWFWKVSAYRASSNSSYQCVYNYGNDNSNDSNSNSNKEKGEKGEKKKEKGEDDNDNWRKQRRK